MKSSKSIILAMCIAAGAATSFASANEPLGILEPTKGDVTKVAHIYFNIATGEKVVTLFHDNQTTGADGGSSTPIWSVLNGVPCADSGHTTEFFFGLDDNSPTSMGGPPTSLATAATLSDYGDIAIDTVVDCVHIDWVTGHTDTDSDSDGIGDGVPGLGGQWTYWDADNARQIDFNSTRLPLVSFTFVDLPGNIFAEDELTGYTADIDLAGTFSSSLTFELGDSDGDLQGASIGNSDVGDGLPVAVADRNFDSLPDSDLDGDGLFDWSWTVRFFQPGTEDFDDDGIIDGDIADSMKPIGVSFAAPDGTAINNGDGTWTWDIDTTTPDAGTGEEDRFVLHSPPDANGDILYAGGFWFGGFECNSLPLPDGPGYTPLAMFEHQLLGPSTIIIDCGDYNGDGVLNFFDISAFLGLFSVMDPLADYNGDGAFNFFDISLFLADFAAGCP
ncbi:MAG: GC-type dockerin domain-anchored protein [Phycisphaerales bacterium]|nr:GC-type dockerin domain-anchored protein [Phycisphaerales bacterium]